MCINPIKRMIAVFDIGKTNKKCFIFDQDYRLVWETSSYLPEITDEDGFPCEDLKILTDWVLETLVEVLSNEALPIKAINCTAYGASFVHLDDQGRVLTPLYNYLKPFPDALRDHFFGRFGTAEQIALETASPILGNLNSGVQLYWLQSEKPLVFEAIKYSLHLPQYIAFLLASGVGKTEIATFAASETTSIGCHTLIWDMSRHDYHHWVKATDITRKFSPIKPSNTTQLIQHQPTKQAIHIGLGLHDSSAALIPYLACFDDPFILISTGTWCISLNPYNHDPLTIEELNQDCLCYLNVKGKPVKAARYFGGNEHEQWTHTLSETFQKPLDYFKSVRFDPILMNLVAENRPHTDLVPSSFKDYETAYHHYMSQLIQRQYRSTMLVFTPDTTQIFVDGGFSKNEVYMRLLARAFPKIDVFTADVAEATALGAAMIIHEKWNKKEISNKMVSLKKYDL